MKKKCLEEQMLWEYIDDELSVKERNEVQMHLEECICCRKHYQDLRSLNSHLVVGFQNNFFDCTKSVEEQVDLGKSIHSPVHFQEYRILWQRLFIAALSTLAIAFVVVAMICPFMDGVPMQTEFNWLRLLIFSLLAIAVKPISMLIIGIIGAIGAGWSLIEARS